MSPQASLKMQAARRQFKGTTMRELASHSLCICEAKISYRRLVRATGCFPVDATSPGRASKNALVSETSLK